MNKTTEALKLAETYIAGMKWSEEADEALAAIREALAEHPIDYDQGFVDGVEAQLADPLQILPGGGAFPFVEVGYVGEFVAPTKSLPAGTPLCVPPAQPVQEHSEQYWLHEINNARAEGYEKGRASCKHDERMLELGVPVQPAKQEPVSEHDLQDVRCECCGYMTHHREHMGCIRAAYAAPVSAKREWVELTDYEIVRLYAESPMCDSEMIAFARAVIAAFKGKNK